VYTTAAKIAARIQTGEPTGELHVSFLLIPASYGKPQILKPDINHQPSIISRLRCKS
jgi:hypothetical protein